MTKLEPTRTSSDLTATERVRELLDERGVEWQSKPELIISGIEKGTEFDAADGRLVRAVEALDGTICLSHITPEQAIAATLGSSSCTNDCTNSERTGTCYITRQFTCSECEYQYPTRNYECYETCDGRTAYASLGYDVLDCEHPNYCPNCGRRVEVD